MNAAEQPEDSRTHVDKGKQRAQEPTEQTPLLGSSSALLNDSENVVQAHSHRRLRATLTTVFLASLSACVVSFILIALLAWSYAARASNMKPEDILNDDLVFAGPDRVNVLNVTKEGLWLQIHGRIGIDAGRAIDINTDPADGALTEVWKAVGRWSVRTLDRVSVNISTVVVTPEHDVAALLSLEIPPIELPLSVNPPQDLSWLTPVSTPVYIRLTSNSTYILEFLKESWRTGILSVRAEVRRAKVRGGGLQENTWRTNFHGKLSNIRTSIHMKIPSIPGLPRHVPFPALSSLIALKSFSVASEPNTLNIAATASVVTPTTLTLSAPSLPFLISLPHLSVPLASVSSSPVTLTHPNTTITVQGHILPIPTDTFPALATFLTRYLSGESNAIQVSSPLLPGYEVEAEFPAPYPRPQILRDVTIKDMKIRPVGTLFLASGIVQGRVVLPAGMHINLDISYVLPDVLVFDGEVPPAPEPDGLSSRLQPESYPMSGLPAIPSLISIIKHKGRRGAAPELPDEPPLPDPLPDRAFAHIRPDAWLPAVSVPTTPKAGEGATYAISAKVVDVPMQVLPGRQKEFSNFVGKVIFGSEGATAGLLGSAAVAVTVQGLPLNTPGRKSGEVALAGLPFQGSVHIKTR